MTTDRLPLWRRPIYATRPTAHLAFAAIFWPVVTVIGATITLMDLPYVPVSPKVALQAALAGFALSLPDMFLAGAIFFGISGFVFSRLGPDTRAAHFGFARLGLEPLLALVAVIAGASIMYPALPGGSPLLAPVVDLPVWSVVVLLMGMVAAGGARAARPGRRPHLAAGLVALGVLSPAPLMIRAALEGVSGRPSDMVVLGIDSVSQLDNVGSLREWAARRNGTWYEYAVAPGLLTNPVWTSILTMKPVSAHHRFHTFERFTAEPALLTAARARGYRTVSIFPDQLTCAVGSRAGFDEDRSGPVGWRQLVLPAVANSSFLLPILKPVFPRMWPSMSPPNHAGTFTYDVRRDIRAVLRAGTRGRRTLVASHLTYTHLPAYPTLLDLSWTDRWKVALSPAGTVEDRSFDWQDTDRASDPIKLQSWKLDYLQRVIQSEVDADHFLANGGQLVLLSDHGHRLGLSEDSFSQERYHHVLLATFGLPARCPRNPISLIDIGALLGLSTAPPAEPVVEFAIADSSAWPELMRTARLRWAGDVDLDGSLLAQVFAGLRQHRPWADIRGDQCQASNSTSSLQSRSR